AEASMDMDSLTRVMSRSLGADDAKITDLSVAARGDGRLEQKGKLHKGVTVPVSTIASVGATPDGKLRLHVDSIRAAGVPAKGLLALFGLDLKNVMDLKASRGIAIEENDIIIAPRDVMPPPAIEGHLAHAEVRGNRLYQTIAPADGKIPAP